MNCRHCEAPLAHTFVDLGIAPPSNAYLTAAELAGPEKRYSLKVMVCERCWLVQTEDTAAADELFGADYAYFSSTSSGWLAHGKRYADKMFGELSLTRDSFVIEIACNDGYLLRNFVAAGIPCLGIEPTASTAQAAEKLGIPVLREFFREALGRRLAAEGKRADLIAGNNVFAHVPDINDFARGLKTALKPGGTITLEFPHIMRLIEHAQFDTIYHEHFSYLSLFTAARIFKTAGLRVFDVEELPTHGGSLRIYGCHESDERATSAAVSALLAEEKRRGLRTLDVYRAFQARADAIRDDLLRFLLERKGAGKSIAAYGAAAKGNTLLNYAGVTPDLLPFVCDAAAAKQGKFMPGSHIPILPPGALSEHPPDFLLILPWNIAGEIKVQEAALAASGTKFVTAVPRLEIGMRVLLTGATGFVGRQVLEALCGRGVAVRAVIREGTEARLAAPVEDIVATPDLFSENAAWWARACAGVDTVVHVAWFSEPESYLHSPKNQACLAGTLQLAEGAVRAGVGRFVGVGTCSEYDLGAGRLNVTTPLKPSTSYAHAKVSTFTALARMLPPQNISFAWCRLFYLYGEGEHERRLVPYLRAQLAAGAPAALSTGEQVRDYLDVREAGRMIAEAALGARQGPINICSGEPITVRALAERIADEYGRRDLLRFGARPDNDFDPPRVVGVLAAG